jgi:hypothetical protein
MKKTNRIAAIAIRLAFVLLPAFVAAKTSAEWSDAGASTVTRESPFACDRLALDGEARRRHFEVLEPALRGLRKSVRELPNGYEFQFPSDPKTIAMVAEWAAGERLCCPFFDIQLQMEKEGGPFWMRLTGRRGTKDVIKADFAEWMKQ